MMCSDAEVMAVGDGSETDAGGVRACDCFVYSQRACRERQSIARVDQAGGGSFAHDARYGAAVGASVP